jgi:hypothetical protein
MGFAVGKLMVRFAVAKVSYVLLQVYFGRENASAVRTPVIVVAAFLFRHNVPLVFFLMDVYVYSFAI